MKNILIIMGNHSPNPSSVSSSMAPLISHISKSYHIDIITDRKRDDISSLTIENGLNIYRVDDKRAIMSNRLNKIRGKKNNGPSKIIRDKFIFGLLIISHLRYVLFKTEVNIGGWEVNSVFSEILKLNKKKEYDLIISVSLPFKSHYIAEKFKKLKGNDIKWLVLEFDPYTFNHTFSNSLFKRLQRYKDEKRIFNNADKVLLTPELYEYYSNNNYFDYNDKVDILPYASLDKIYICKDNVSRLFLNKIYINCLFIGRIYNDIRNPKYLLNIFKNIQTDIKLTLISNYTYEDIDKLTGGEYSPVVIPFQNRDTALFNLMNADILINIGNTVEYQVPGKIFEYMSTGKPIIHFSKIENDPALKYFEKYPKVLIINEWENNMEKDRIMIENFCINEQGNTLSFEKVNNSVGKYSSNNVKNKFENIIAQLLGE